MHMKGLDFFSKVPCLCCRHMAQWPIVTTPPCRRSGTNVVMCLIEFSSEKITTFHSYFITVWSLAEHGIAILKIVCPSVRPSVCNVGRWWIVITRIEIFQKQCHGWLAYGLTLGRPNITGLVQREHPTFLLWFRLVPKSMILDDLEGQ